ncbi:MAG: DUF456 domain-containing protein [Anaerolineae bacterium]
MNEGLLIALTLVVMVGVMVISLVPFVPGPLLMWLVGMAFGVVESFERLTVPFAVLMSVLMLIGMTTDFWMPVLGMRAQGASCWGALGTLLGGLVGTFLIPLPICGTLVGAIIGALLFEFIHAGDARLAFTAGKSALKLFIASLVVEVIATFLIFLVFILSLYLTG